MDCSFKKTIGSECGSYYSDSTLLPLNSCNVDITSHLVVLGISGKRGRSVAGHVSERDLILNRVGLFYKSEEFISALTICPKHRKELSTDWPGKKRYTCGYPGFSKSRPAAQRPAAHGPPRPSGPAARRPSGPRPTARDGPAARRPGGPEAHTVLLSSGKSTRMLRFASV